jgi:hypothetical protein
MATGTPTVGPSGDSVKRPEHLRQLQLHLERQLRHGLRVVGPKLRQPARDQRESTAGCRVTGAATGCKN